MTEISDAIETNATGPRRVRVGNQEVEQHPLKDQIEADNHVAAKTAATRNHLGIRFRKIIPPGAG